MQASFVRDECRKTKVGELQQAVWLRRFQQQVFGLRLEGVNRMHENDAEDGKGVCMVLVNGTESNAFEGRNQRYKNGKRREGEGLMTTTRRMEM